MYIYRERGIEIEQYISTSICKSAAMRETKGGKVEYMEWKQYNKGPKGEDGSTCQTLNYANNN